VLLNNHSLELTRAERRQESEEVSCRGTDAVHRPG
jgi:hypothetical protein